MIIPEDKREIEYAQKTTNIINKCIERELEHVKMRRENILDERKYFSDYFNELKDDEKKDLLDNELLDTNAYMYSLDFLARLSKQLKEPYFAGFTFCEEGEKPETYYLSIQTLRNPENDDIVTTDWRAPVASLYYEAEPGEAKFSAPMGDISGELSVKRKYVFKDGKLVKYADIGMPSDDEVLCEVLKQNANTHMKTIIQTIQKEQYKIVRDYIEGVSVIQGCAGSGKSSIALHKAAYILYTFRERLKDGGITIISPNKVFSEYISSVLPDLGEENIQSILPEDVIYDALFNMEGFRFVDRISQQEIICSGSSESAWYKKNADYKATMEFRNVAEKYIKYLQQNIFVAEDLYLDEDGNKKVEAQLLKDLFYSVYSDLPIMSRTEEMARFIGDKYKVKKAENIDQIRQNLNFMIMSYSMETLYRKMYEVYPEISEYAPKEIIWEDACVMALIYIALYEPNLNGNNFYLIADEAQDFTPIYLELLKYMFKGTNMLFVGDINQRIMGNKGNYAEDIKNIIKRRPFRKYELNTNYRSTKQIVEYASRFSTDDSEFRCVREGSMPIEKSAVNIEEAALIAMNYINEMAEKGYESVAIVCKSKAEADVFEKIINTKYSLHSKINIKVLPLYLAKGLEYDCVAVWDISRDCMYTACTRAMHELLIINKGE